MLKPNDSFDTSKVTQSATPHSTPPPGAQLPVLLLRCLCLAEPISHLALLDVKETTNICPCHADAPEVGVDDASNAEVQAGPGGCIVTRPMRCVTPSTWERGPVGEKRLQQTGTEVRQEACCMVYANCGLHLCRRVRGPAARKTCGNAEVQAGPGGCIVTCPMGGIAPCTRECGPANDTDETTRDLPWNNC
jgi:hypothetical protein